MILAKVEWCDGQSACGLIYDVSLDGMLVICEAAADPGTCVDIFVDCHDHRTIRIPALVVHRREYGFGVMFRKLDDAIRKLIDECLTRY